MVADTEVYLRDIDGGTNARWIVCNRNDPGAVLFRPATALSQDGWLPIESAPKDGTSIFVYIANERGVSGVFMAEWDDGEDAEPDDELAFVPAWRVSYSEEWFEAPTHWQPLPEPPK